MERVLDVLQDSAIALKGGKDDRSRFWGIYKRIAEEHDGEFLERYNGDMDIVLVFSGLFSAISTSFIVAMEYKLSPDPSDTTNALLTQLVQIGLGNIAEAGSTPAAPASTFSPSTSDIRIQTIAYASLSMSLLAAFGAVLGKQWLGYYKSNRYGRGSQEERGKRRQEKFDGIITWYFDGVVQSFPILLQISLLLFGIALSANIWYEQPTIAWVVISTTVFGFLFYSLTVMASLISPACPFQTPISTILRMFRIDRVLRLVFKPASRYFQQFTTSVYGELHFLTHAHILIVVVRCAAAAARYLQVKLDPIIWSTGRHCVCGRLIRTVLSPAVIRRTSSPDILPGFFDSALSDKGHRL
ncbi:uncharacterized protein EDB91DRAFT_173492 [Suillus paluster]|uniref:uncharacterized protein n=1 Tax=Suillus paluster TaxID=48578 RepID=UPI001B87D41E|nr:uncharacterized protein EDB91DRAFT_173492 [Suillus paluster]KAG1745040.1 hypothetical protein EDB91DRAFT_173492 [Suillus paluster]